MTKLRKISILFVLALMLVSLTGVQGCEEVLSEIEYILTVIPTPEDLPGTQPPATKPPATKPPATQPPSGGGDWYSLYFNTPRYPDKDQYHYGGIDEELVVVIEEAQKTIDVCAYEFDLEGVAHALVRAKDRGVVVRLVTDTDNVDEEGTQILKKAKVKIVEDDRGAIMHNKFLVVDGEWVWTGSWNLTVNGTYRNNNNAMLIHSPALARNYQIKFNAMFEDKEFGPSREAGTTEPVLQIQGVKVENYFAPEDEVAEKLVRVIQGAKKSILFMAFSFTHEDIGDAMIARAKEGVEVRGVFESRGSDTQYSEYGAMKKAKLDVMVDGNPYVMHHKVIIVDGEIVVMGSYNFSANADESNDENVLIIYSPEIAAQYEAEFLRVYETALNPPKKD